MHSKTNPSARGVPAGNVAQSPYIGYCSEQGWTFHPLPLRLFVCSRFVTPLSAQCTCVCLSSPGHWEMPMTVHPALQCPAAGPFNLTTVCGRVNYRPHSTRTSLFVDVLNVSLQLLGSIDVSSSLPLPCLILVGSARIRSEPASQLEHISRRDVGRTLSQMGAEDTCFACPTQKKGQWQYSQMIQEVNKAASC